MTCTDQTWLVDAHVHLHAADRVRCTLDAARSNFSACGAAAHGMLGLLLLTQTSAERVFEALRERPIVDGWRIEPAAEEDVSLVAGRDGASIGIVCGRQLRTEEGLEVLALGTLAEFQDGRPLAESVDAVRESGALPVLPWAFGKWTGARGRLVETLLDPARASWLFVGDNGGRPELAGIPRLLSIAAARGFRRLPGTDPFPVVADYDRTGSFGFRIRGALSVAAPWRSMSSLLCSGNAEPEPYGRGCGAWRFVRNQAVIRLLH
jgi:hypothetical protein